MYVVYALVDPRDNQAHYVGATEDVYQRFQAHINCAGNNAVKNAWISELRAANKMVIMQMLQEVDGVEEARKREAYWIRHYRDLGMPLTNIAFPSLRSTLSKLPMEVMDTDMNIEQQIRTLIAENKALSARRIASHIGCSPTTASKWKSRIEQQEKE